MKILTRIKRCGLFLAVAVFAVNAWAATTWYVSPSGSDSNMGDDQWSAKATIQAAIDVSSAGDTILVAAGTYAAIDTQGKDITIRSTDGAANTKIVGSTSLDLGMSSAIAACLISDETNSEIGDSSEDGESYEYDVAEEWDSWTPEDLPGSTLEGFTIEVNSMPSVQSADEIDGEYYGVVGGRVKNCRFTCKDNLKGYAHLSLSVAENCLFVSSTLSEECISDCSLRNCTVYTGAYLCSVEMENTIVYARNAKVYLDEGDVSPTLSNCVFYNVKGVSGRSGVTVADPKFANAASGDFQIVLGSPCIDKGGNAYGTTDLAGNERVVNGTIDIGCYECQEIPDDVLSDSYGPFIPGEEVMVAVTELVGYTASGLPTGLKFDSKTGVISGAATKPTDDDGVTVTFTKRGAETLTTQFIVGPFLTLSTFVNGDSELGSDSEYGTITGAGGYAIGAKVTLKAVAKKGYVFAGWSGDEVDELFEEQGVDFRTATITYVMPDYDAEVYADFVSADEDAEELTAGMDGEEFEVDGEWEFEIYVDSITVPTVKVSGLPKGLTYNAKTMTISGTPTVPGLYEVTLTLSNTSIKNKTEVFTIRVPNLDSDYIYASWDADDDFYLLAGVSVYDYGEEMYAYAEDGWTLRVSGLPTGLTYNSRTGEITGKPTKIGNYTVTFTATRSGWPTQTATRTIVVEGLLVDLYVMGDEDGMKSLSGDGEYAVGSKVTLKAVANTGYVFAGWYWDEDNPCYALGVDYRTANVSYTMEEWDSLELYARFVSMEEDAAELSAHMDGAEFTVDGGWSMELGREITSVTVPTVKVSGLPKGLTFNSKTLVISGTPTTPGVYEVTLTLSNTSIKNKTEKFTITVPNLTSDYITIEGLDDYEWDADTPFSYKLGVSTANYDSCWTLANLAVTAEKGWTLTATGLPAGLKYDAKTGTISGTPTKAGTYTVTFTAKQGKSTETTTRTFVVEALPTRVIGTFTGTLSNGDGLNVGTFTLTATDAGKITAKVTMATGTSSFSGSWLYNPCIPDGYSFAVDTMKGETLFAKVNLEAAWNTDSMSGSFYNPKDDAEYSVSARKNLLADKWYLAAEANGNGAWAFTFVETAKEANLTVTPKGDGTVAIAGKIGTYSVSASSILSFDQLANGNGMFQAEFVSFVTVNKEKKALSINCDLYFNHTAGGSAGWAKLVD